MIIKKKEFYKFFILGLFIIFLDQTTKSFARTYLYKPIYITSFFSLDLSFNKGISWGLFYSQNSQLFYFISFIIVLVLFIFGIYIYNIFKSNKSIILEILIFFAGLSNLIDRFFYEGVTDFLAFNFCGFHFPNFNIADIFISLGVFSMFIKIFFYEDL